MRPSSITIPMNLFEMNFTVYCPMDSQASGVLVIRKSPIQFIFGYLKEHPRTTPFPEDYSLFNDAFSGFEWTCPMDYQEALLAGQITIKDINDDWDTLKRLRINHAMTNFKPLSEEELNDYFPKEQLVIKRPQAQLVKESKRFSEIVPNQHIFFRDRYDGEWFLNKMDDQRCYIIQVSYWHDKRSLRLESDVYVMKESLLSFFEEYKGKGFNDLMLTDLILLKNKAMEYHLSQSAPKELTESFSVLPKERTAKWMNPAKFYFEEVTF